MDSYKFSIVARADSGTLIVGGLYTYNSPRIRRLSCVDAFYVHCCQTKCGLELQVPISLFALFAFLIARISRCSSTYCPIFSILALVSIKGGYSCGLLGLNDILRGPNWPVARRGNLSFFESPEFSRISGLCHLKTIDWLHIKIYIKTSVSQKR